jgi:hypothetical protein
LARRNVASGRSAYAARAFWRAGGSVKSIQMDVSR